MNDPLGTPQLIQTVLYFKSADIKCPSCGNKYIIEIQKTSKCATSPKSSFFPGTVLSTMNAMQRPASSISIEKKKVEENAIGGGGIPKTSHSFSSIGK